MSREFTFTVSETKEDIITLYSDSLDWEIEVPLDFFPDPFHVDIDDIFLLKTSIYQNQDIVNNKHESGGIIKNKKTKFKI